MFIRFILGYSFIFVRFGDEPQSVSDRTLRPLPTLSLDGKGMAEREAAMTHCLSCVWNTLDKYSQNMKLVIDRQVLKNKNVSSYCTPLVTDLLDERVFDKDITKHLIL